MTDITGTTENSPAPAPTDLEDREIRLISFRLGEEEFGVAVENVREILKMTEITPVPRAPDYLLGMMNLRGVIIPVLDPRVRLKLPGQSEHTADVRILVLQVDGGLSGVRVDEVFEVQSIPAAAVEPPPQVTRGIDKFYLHGVVKQSAGGRLIMMLNLIEVLNIEVAKTVKTTTETAAPAEDADPAKQEIQEEQLVHFILGEQEFGLDIAAVQEILKIETITAVPNVPPYVKGIQEIRGQVLPIVGMRNLLNMRDLLEDDKLLVESLKNGHLEWMERLRESLHQGVPFTRTLDPTHCDLGRLLEHMKHQGIEFLDMYKKFKTPHDGLHLTAAKMLTVLKKDKQAAEELFQNTITPHLETLMGLFAQLESLLLLQADRDQRVLIVTIAGAVVGLLVDRVTEVSRLPKNLIDTTLAGVSTYGRELKGVAKLDNGKRLILIIDETLLIPSEDIDSISRIHDEDQLTGVAEKEIIEKQFVVFSIRGEEFGVTIENVREIYKAESITPVPKSPVFIEGVINLRGNIVPVVNTRERFGVSTGEESADPGTGKEVEKKILVTTIKDTVVGLLVDNVHEVLRIREDIIEDAPALVLSAVDNAYLDGIAKLENGERIILMLNVNEVMNRKDFEKLKRITAKAEADAARDKETGDIRETGDTKKTPAPPGKEAPKEKVKSKPKAKPKDKPKPKKKPAPKAGGKEKK